MQLPCIAKAGKCSTDLSNMRGAWYEVETALKLHKLGEVIKGFGVKISKLSSTRSYDIETELKLIECKAWDWTKTQESYKSIFAQAQKIAQAVGKIYEIHSKTPITQEWKSFLKQKNIPFVEDYLN